MTQTAKADAFAAALSRRTGCEVAYDDGMLAAYSFDASNHRVPPRSVAFPRSVDDVVAVVDACRAEGVPVTSRGGGTNLTGSAIGPGVVLDHSRYRTAVVSVDPTQRRAVVEPGVVLDDLQAIAARHGLRFGPDPSTHDRCTVGGMIGTNACGARAIAWGTTAENTLAVDLVLADGTTTTLGHGSTGPLTERLTAVRDRWLGEIRRELGRFGRQVSGYSMQYLLAENGFDLAKAYVGSEGTCAIVTSATLRLVPRPARRHLVIAGFGSLVEVAAVAPAFGELDVIAVEGMDEALVCSYDARSGAHSRPELPSGSAWLVVEVGGDDEQESRDRATTAARMARDAGAREVRVVDDPAQQAAIWRVRERGAGLAARMPDGTEYWPGWEDAAVPAGRLADYLTDFDVLVADYGRRAISYGHFGEGCVHSRVDHDLLSEAGRADYRRFQHDAAALVARYGGSLSGEHGDGRSRSELLGAMYSEQMLAGFAAFKAAFDPGNLFNPGILVDPVAVDDALRLALAGPHTSSLGFRYPEDDGDFGKAIRRCVGVGACRSWSGGMCPSYRATLDERHSTRGRARILAEMLDGSLATDGWQSDATAEALDLCLMCKACSSECPVAVDMASYKAEFLHQRYRHRARPRSHYALGWLPLWLAAGRRVPRVVNTLMGFPPAATGLRLLGGIDPGRELPRLPVRGVRRRAGVARSAAGRHGQDPVLLWHDTFTTAFGPDILTDAVTVLSAAGYAVRPAGAGQCCGLTLLSTGQLGLARAVLSRSVATLDSVPGSPPIVVLEPSCAAALRDDAVKLLDSDAARRVAKRVVGLAQALDGRDLALEPEKGSAVVQFHCHQRATADLSPDLRLLDRLGLTVSSVEEGCCGLAGNFGFESGHFEVSRTCAEQSFLPYLRSAPAASVLADGFSCRLQMTQLGADALGGRRPRHLAQLIASRLLAGEP